MAAPMKTSMPQNVVIGATYTLQIAALDPNTGNAVAGVKFSNMAIEIADPGTVTAEELNFGPFMLVPGPGA